MNRKILAAALAATLAPSLAIAEDAALTVTATVVPTACVPSFTGGDTVDLGGIGAATLNKTTQTDLLPIDTELAIVCDAPAAVSVIVLDNAKSSAAAVVPAGVPDHYSIFGLGTIGDVKIGAYGLKMGTPTADGVAMQPLYKRYSSSSWQLREVGGFMGAFNRYSSYHSWGVTAASGPAAATVHTLPLSVVPAITKGDDLPLTDEIPMAGSATFVVYYQ